MIEKLFERSRPTFRTGIVKSVNKTKQTATVSLQNGMDVRLDTAEDVVVGAPVIVSRVNHQGFIVKMIDESYPTQGEIITV